MNDLKPSIIKCREIHNATKTGGYSLTRDKAWRTPVYCPGGDRHKDGMNAARAYVRNVGTCGADAKGNGQGEELARRIVPMRHRGADCPVVVMNPGNAGGAKGTSGPAEDMDQPAMGGILDLDREAT